MNRLPTLKRKLAGELGKRELLRGQCADLAGRVKQLKATYGYVQQAIATAAIVAQQTQEQLEFHLNELVSTALETVFPHPYKLRVKFGKKRNSTEAEILFLDGEGNEVDPMDGSGCGPVDVACFALRLCLWSMRKPRTRNTIVMDETFKHVSTDLQPKVGELLRELSDTLGLQFIFVTHEDELTQYADRSFYVSKVGTITVVCVDSKETLPSKQPEGGGTLYSEGSGTEVAFQL